MEDRSEQVAKAGPLSGAGRQLVRVLVLQTSGAQLGVHSIQNPHGTRESGLV